jgi:tight adherence protein C
MELVGAAVAFVAVLLLMLALGGAQAPIRARLDSIRPQGRDEGMPSVTQRVLGPATQDLLQSLSKVLPAGMLQRMEERLILAGEPMTVQGFLAMRLICAGLFIILPFFIVIAGGFGFGLPALGMIGLFGVIGILLPQMWLAQRIGHRQAEIIKSLPDAFDLITTCVEAGLGLDAALARVAEKVEGAFADELNRMLRDVALGKMRREALRELASRTGVPDLITFVNAVIQAEQMGSSVGAVLRVQSEQLRVRRRQRAEEQAYKAPVKMIFPLVLCIFPTLFIVILGPAVITIMRDFPAGK